MEESMKDLIQKIDIFRDLNKETIETLVSGAFTMKLTKGEALFAEREEVHNIYIVVGGKLTIYRLTELGQKKVIYILDQGQLMNEVILDSRAASAYCEAFEDSWVVGINKEAFLRAMAMDFKLTERVVHSMGRKIRRLYRQIKNTIPIRVDKKLAAKLWKLSKDYGVEIEEGTLINLNLSITYLADMLGSTRETVSKCLKKLKQEGLIEYDHKRIIVKNRQQLSIYFRGA